MPFFLKKKGIFYNLLSIFLWITLSSHHAVPIIIGIGSAAAT